MTSSHLFRIASVTKTFTAATLLRLVEDGKLSLEARLNTLIDPGFDTLLTQDGYATDQITLKHLLSHTAGLFDHAQSQPFFDELMETPLRDKTLAEHIQGAVEWGDPVGTPGEQFFYSDTGYVLLGHIIERASGLPLPIAVRQYLKFKETGLEQVIWERGDSVAVPHQLRVHQRFNDTDTYDWSPTVDLYGGGGLVASPRGMAMFYRQLFTGKIFSHPATLGLMLSSEGLPERSPYRLGIFEKSFDGLKVYEHSGFWGTSVMYAPSANIAIAGAVVRQEDYKMLIDVMRCYLQQVGEQSVFSEDSE